MQHYSNHLNPHPQTTLIETKQQELLDLQTRINEITTDLANLEDDIFRSLLKHHTIHEITEAKDITLRDCPSSYAITKEIERTSYLNDQPEYSVVFLKSNVTLLKNTVRIITVPEKYSSYLKFLCHVLNKPSLLKINFNI